jgi:hexosaminidase
VILRNISNNQDTRALNDFRTFEPLKITNNGGGKKYRMHSPLTLFADANADAPEALDFNAAVKII